MANSIACAQYSGKRRTLLKRSQPADGKTGAERFDQAFVSCDQFCPGRERKGDVKTIVETAMASYGNLQRSNQQIGGRNDWDRKFGETPQGVLCVRRADPVAPHSFPQDV